MRFPPLTTLAAATAALLALAAPAHAGPLLAEASDCDSQELERPFAPWADPAQYVLVPNGILETGRHWDLDGPASRVHGNERFYVHGAHEYTSLALPPGSSATTAAMCVGVEHPTLRFFARNRGSLFSPLLVEVLFEDAGGKVRSAPIGAVSGGSGWQPTPPLPLAVNLLPLLPGKRTPVAFRFTPLGDGGEWSIDDVYVDPWRHG